MIETQTDVLCESKLLSKMSSKKSFKNVFKIRLLDYFLITLEGLQEHPVKDFKRALCSIREELSEGFQRAYLKDFKGTA